RWRRWARSASSRCASSSAAADTWPEVAGAPVVWASASGGMSTGGNATERKAEEDAPPPGETDPPPGSRGTPRSGKRKRMHPLLDGGAPLTAAATTTHHHRPDTPALGERAGPAVAFFARAADYLHRPSRACPRHHVIHTGKLARAIPLDLALLRATGEPAYARRAIEQARFVTSRLARDPEHGGWIYLPGRFDPRNCSNSIIDSGECTGALAQLLLAPDATLTPDDRAAFASAVERNAATYLCRAVLEKEITNQRLWGAMGLASAYRLDPRAAWRDVLVQAVEQSLDEQGRDGAWG